VRNRQVKREDWRRDVGAGQQNVLPLDAARNEGRFLGTILLGTGRLTLVQRIGTIIIAIPFLAGGFGTLGILLTRLDKLQLEDPVRPVVGTIGNAVVGVLVLAILVVFLSVGFRLVLNAIRSPHTK
jgi:hypothetical protein